MYQPPVVGDLSFDFCWHLDLRTSLWGPVDSVCIPFQYFYTRESLREVLGKDRSRLMGVESKLKGKLYSTVKDNCRRHRTPYDVLRNQGS